MNDNTEAYAQRFQVCASAACPPCAIRRLSKKCWYKFRWSSPPLETLACEPPLVQKICQPSPLRFCSLRVLKSSISTTESAGFVSATESTSLGMCVPTISVQAPRFPPAQTPELPEGRLEGLPPQTRSPHRGRRRSRSLPRRCRQLFPPWALAKPRPHCQLSLHIRRHLLRDRLPIIMQLFIWPLLHRKEDALFRLRAHQRSLVTSIVTPAVIGEQGLTDTGSTWEGKVRRFPLQGLQSGGVLWQTWSFPAPHRPQLLQQVLKCLHQDQRLP